VIWRLPEMRKELQIVLADLADNALANVLIPGRVHRHVASTDPGHAQQGIVAAVGVLPRKIRRNGVVNSHEPAYLLEHTSRVSRVLFKPDDFDPRFAERVPIDVEYFPAPAGIHDHRLPRDRVIDLGKRLAG